MRFRLHHLPFLLLTTSCLLGADWLEFRGNDNQSIAEGANYPLTWSATENVAWKAPPARRRCLGADCDR